MKTPPRLETTMRIRVPETMAAGLAHIAFAKSHERGLRVGVSSVAREAMDVSPILAQATQSSVTGITSRMPLNFVYTIFIVVNEVGIE